MEKRILFALSLTLLIAACSEAPKQTPNTEQTPLTTIPPTDTLNTSKALPQSLMTDTIKRESIVWRCFGTEPFWSIDISEAKNIIKYRPMDGDSMVMPFVKADEKEVSWVFKTSKLKVVIKKEKCSDGMSDTEHEYSSIVTMNGKDLKGCARKG
jgi:uncharacterized membrane protein